MLKVMADLHQRVNKTETGLAVVQEHVGLDSSLERKKTQMKVESNFFRDHLPFRLKTPH